MIKILISAFEPFGGEESNASWEALQQTCFTGKKTVLTLQVPTVFGLAGETLLRAVHEFRPDVVIALGQAAGRSAITPERIAFNIRDARIADNAGNMPKDEEIVPGGPLSLRSTLPVRAMVNASLRSGIPAHISSDAGKFVCNDLMYTLLYELQKNCPETKGGFIHVPAFLPNPHDEAMPYMSLNDIAKGLDAMFDVASR